MLVALVLTAFVVRSFIPRLASMITLFVLLLTAHMLYDWHWQGDTLGSLKCEESLTGDIALGVHSLTYGLVLATTLYLYNGWMSIGWLFCLTVTHFVIDLWKARDTKLPFTKAIFIDQGAHFLVIALMTYSVVKGV